MSVCLSVQVHFPTHATHAVGTRNRMVLCVSVQVWSTDHVTQDGEDAWMREVNGTVCVCAGVVNRPCRTGSRRREDEGIESYCVWM